MATSKQAVVPVHRAAPKSPSLLPHEEAFAKAIASVIYDEMQAREPRRRGGPRDVTPRVSKEQAR